MGKRKKSRPQQNERRYAGAVINRLNSDWIAASTSADSEIWSSLRILRDRSRSLCRDNDYAIGAVRTILSNVLGENGIRMQSKVKLQRGDRLNDPLNKNIEDLWKRWQNPCYCDVRGILAWPQLERIALRSVIESGEVLIRKVPQRFEDSPVPFALQVIESDQLADDYSLNLKPNAGNVVKMGVELDQWERPVAYWVYPYHPGDQLLYSHDRNRSQPIRVPASEIIHLYVCDRPGQTRGVPWFAAAINRLRHMGGYEEAEIIKARAHACAMGFIQSPEAGSFGEDKGDGGKKQLGFEAGTIHTLEPGETFNGFAPTSPNQGLDPFLRFMLRGVAAGIGVPSDALSMDYSQTTYGGQRAAMLDARDYWGVVQQWLSSALHQKVFEAWLEQAFTYRAISLPGYEVDPRWYNHPAWMPRGWSWIDPSKDVNASIAAITNGLSTLGRELAAQGLDFDELVEDRRREVDLLKKAKIAVEIYPETMPEPPAPEAGGAGVDETPPVAPKEGLQAVRSTDEWVQYFSAELDKDENFGKRDLILDHWADCLVSGQFSELTERSIDLAKPEQPSTDEKEMNITLNVNIDGVSRSVDVADQPRSFAYGLTPIRPWEGLRAKKKCKAKPCGNTCIASSKACLQGLTPEQKKLAQAAGKAMQGGKAGAAVDLPDAPKAEAPTEPTKEKGGALAVSNGKLTKAEKIESRKTDARFPGDERDAIDSKFAKDNPSEKDVSSWLKARMDNDFKDTPDHVEHLARVEIIESFVGNNPDHVRFSKDIKDADSYAAASVALEKAQTLTKTIEINGKNYTRLDVEYWIYQNQEGLKGLYKQQVEKAEKTLSSTKTKDAAKQKAQKFLDKYNEDLKKSAEISKATHQKVLAKHNAPDGDRIAHFKAEYSTLMDKARPKAQAFVKAYAKGEKSEEGVQRITKEIYPDGNQRVGGNVHAKYLTNRAATAVHSTYLKGAGTRQELKDAFKDFARKNHPDYGGDKALFQKVNAKYQELLQEM